MSDGVDAAGTSVLGNRPIPISAGVPQASTPTARFANNLQAARSHSVWPHSQNPHQIRVFDEKRTDEQGVFLATGRIPTQQIYIILRQIAVPFHANLIFLLLNRLCWGRQLEQRDGCSTKMLASRQWCERDRG
jgi:hypothetical protein